jgi:hypothetical protein
VRLHKKTSPDECSTVSQVFTRPLARRFEQNTEERLANLEESPRGFQERFACQRDERGDILSYIREISGEEIQKETKVNKKVSR